MSAIAEIIKTRQKRLEAYGFPLQPFGTIIGKEHQQYCIILHGKKYLVQSSIRVLELLYKSIHALNLEYPPELTKAVPIISTTGITEGMVEKLKENIGLHFGRVEAIDLEVKPPNNRNGIKEHGEILTKMLKQLEDRVEEQSQVIKHLISQNSTRSEVNTTPPSSSSSISIDKRADNSVKFKSSSSVLSKSGNTAGNKNKTEEQQTVKNKNEVKSKQNGIYPNIIKGTAEIAEEDKFKATPKKAWLYIGRAQPNTCEKRLTNYLKKKFPAETFEVEELKKHENNTNKNKSFRIGFDFDLLKLVLKPEV
ncbi:unnamed protein product [Brassicogethes aeneus]|uniref:Uncharacterized protein n=1 Tax=Brassicogethes aeneus TaxID=1431903 RepID=A0A9P0B043_BRAAE|nr:unnamed protein product [Brassicogethes aeneus]